MNVLCALIGLLILLVIGLGWIIPLVIGIVKRKTALGIVLIVLSCTWVLFIGLMSFGLFVISRIETRGMETVKFNPDTYDGPVGTIKVSFPAKTTLYLIEEKNEKRYQVDSDSNELITPCGRFKLYMYAGSIPADDGTRWSVNTYLYNKKCYAQIEPGSVVELVFGPPLEASVSPGKQGTNVRFNFNLRDSAGNKYTLARIGSKLPPPKFNVVDAAGTVVWSDAFEFG
jgi:hypothetical protein